MQPSEEQTEIVNLDKDTIVTSNPGTGKTTTLSLKVMKLLEGGVKPEGVLCITFTEKAKKEMFDKIFSMTKGKIPDTEIMKINIHTFHSFAYNYLVDAGIIPGDIVENNILRYSILQSFEKNSAFNYGKGYIISEFVPKTENAIRYIKSFGITPDKINVQASEPFIEDLYPQIRTSYKLEEVKAFLHYFVKAYQDYEKSKGGKVDYTDMLLKFIESFDGEKFDYVLVDEMQDMNEIEAKIASMVGNNIFLVGDAKQAIFGFQGGSIKNFQKFKETCKPMILSLNRRSSQQILDYSKSFFLTKTQSKELFEKELETFTSLDTGIVPKVVSTGAPLSRILTIIEQNPGKNIGILTRTNKQIIEISQYLDSCNIPYSSTSSQATTEQAKTDILNYLRGLISDKLDDKVASAFTVFSPFTLKEAFEMSEDYSNREYEKLAKIKSWGLSLKKSDIDDLFKKTIFPLCVSKGREWFSTSLAVKGQIEQYFTLGIPTMEGLFDFISTSEESYNEMGTESKVTLTTVHKAKGRDFDVVAYLPITSNPRASFVDIIVKAIMLSLGIDTKEELEEESLRVDFVAFTRAKEKLIIITNDRNVRNYHLEQLSEIDIDDKREESVMTKLDNRLAEAFSLFVGGRFEDSEKLLKAEDGWLEQVITNYFKEMDHFSYSSVIPDPYEFLIKKIIAIPEHHEAADFGSEVHNALAKILKKEAKIDDYKENVRRAVENALNAIEQLRKEHSGLEFVDAEWSRQMPLRSLIQYDDATLIFKGKVDAIFKYDDGFLILDYKTDRNTNYSDDHKRQLSVYRKMYSVLQNIPENKIKICIVFLALRGGINTGRFDWSIEEERRNAFPTFVKHLQTVLEWKKDPRKFIQDLLSKPNTDLLYQIISEKLKSNSETLR